MTLTAAVRKSHGAFYTPSAVATFLTRWAIRSPDDVVLDPSAGDGVFLQAAAMQLRARGGSERDQVVGVEVRADTCAATAADLTQHGFAVSLRQADFFSVMPADTGGVDAVIGNPPFIRYQRFSGDVRRQALLRAREAGVPLSGLASSWAPFLVHAVQFLEPGGRLGVVAPGELAHAAYAQPLIKYFCEQFRDVSLVTFDRRIFSHLGEDTVLLMCDGRGEAFSRFALARVPDVAALGETASLDSSVVMDAPAVSRGAVRMSHYLLPAATRALIERLQSHALVRRLGDLAEVGIGYVTGANDFFHLSKQEIRAAGVESRFLKRAVRRGASFRGLRFTTADWCSQRDEGEKNTLLRIGARADLSANVRRYVLKGRRAGVATAFKCRIRDPWYAVPHVHVGDAFLTYMSGTEPRLVANVAKVVAPNTLHVVRMRPSAPLDAPQLAAAWQSSLVKLSCELSGHSLGGGMLKLEPSEAQSLLIPLLKSDEAFVDSLDLAAREGRWPQVTDAIDSRIALVLGLSPTDIALLKDGVDLLRTRRTRR